LIVAVSRNIRDFERHHVAARTWNLIIDSTIVRAHQHAAEAKKGGSEDEAIGRSRGGLSTKINIGADALGNPVRFILTPGQVHDILQAEDLISGFPFENLLADKGYDSDRFRACIAERGAEAVIPSSRSRSQAIPYDKHTYRQRNLVERFINKIVTAQVGWGWQAGRL
jgi:transposase